MGTPIKLLLIAMISVSAEGAGQTARAPFSVKISVPEATVRAGAIVRVTVTVLNTSDHKIGAGRSNGNDQGEFNNHLEVWDANGNPPPETKYRRRLRGERDEHDPPSVVSGSDITYWLEPGKSLEEFLLVNKLYDVSKPGKYTLQVSRFDQYSKTLVKSNTITLAVTP